MNEFYDSDDLIRKIKADIKNAIGPSLLTKVSAVVRKTFIDELNEKLKSTKTDSVPDVTELFVTKIPLKASILIFGEANGRDVESFTEIVSGYYDDKLSDRAKFYLLLNQNGV